MTAAAGAGGAGDVEGEGQGSDEDEDEGPPPTPEEMAEAEAVLREFMEGMGAAGDIERPDDVPGACGRMGGMVELPGRLKAAVPPLQVLPLRAVHWLQRVA